MNLLLLKIMRVKINDLELTFFGTKGLIEESSKAHTFHTSILIKSNKVSILLDYGEKNQKNLEKIRPNFLLCSHSHPDHLSGFEGKYIICSRDLQRTAKINFPRLKFLFLKVFDYYKPFKLGDIRVYPIPVYHSIKAPMTAFIFQKGKTKIWIGTDFLGFKAGDFQKYFRDIDTAVIDGSSMFRDLIRFKEIGKRRIQFGHLSIVKQLAKMRLNVNRGFIVTHCGKDIVKDLGDELALRSLRKITPNIIIATDEK